MPWNLTRSGQFIDKEVLKYATGRELKDSVVIDANAFPMPSDRNARNIVPAGTILKLSATDPSKMVEYGGGGAGVIKGILAHSVELMAQASTGSEPAPMYFHSAVFATSSIVGFTAYASALRADMPTCQWL